MSSRKRSKSRSRSKSRGRDRWKEVKERKTRGRKICTYFCNHCRFFNKFLINAENHLTALYYALRNLKTIRFVNEFTFVNCKLSFRGKGLSCVIRGFKTDPNWTVVKWPDIKCKNHSKNIKTSPCSIGSRKNKKVFFKKAVDLKSYILGLRRNDISLKEHNELFGVCANILGKRFINSNREVKLLHFKQR